MTKAPLSGEKTGPNPTDRGKSGVKHSLLTEGHGVPIDLTIEVANRHDMKLLRPTIESIIIKRPEPTEDHPQGMCLDKGYDYDEVRDSLGEFGFTAHIRPRGEEAKAIKREADFKARRWMVDRYMSWPGILESPKWGHHKVYTLEETSITLTTFITSCLFTRSVY